jgi:hypothetical protein
MLSIFGYTAEFDLPMDRCFRRTLPIPQKVSGGTDIFNVDRPGDAIAYFSGHGICDDQTGI